MKFTLKNPKLDLNDITKMKAIWIVFFLGVLGIAGMSFGQSVSGTELEIGNSGSNQVFGGPGGAIGTYNEVYGGLAVGYSNHVYYASLAVGMSNTTDLYSATFGNGNMSYASCSLLVGGGNFAAGNQDEGAYGCLVAGGGNFVNNWVGNSIVSGFNNAVDGNPDPSNPAGQWLYVESTATLGRGLFNHWMNCTVVGQYNDSSMNGDSGLLFAIGNGSGASDRSNALEVYSNGRINIPRQGDILMGEFGNPE